MKKKILSVCTFLIVVCSSSFAQSHNFQYSADDTVNNFSSYSAVPLKGTGYEFLYFTADLNYDYNTYIQQLDSTGKASGAPINIGAPDSTQGYAILQTADDGFIIGGDANTGTIQAFLIKTDNKGNIQWSNFYGPATNLTEYMFGLDITKDGGYVIAGYTSASYYSSTQIFVARTDKQGDTLWTRTYGDTSLHGAATSIQSASDGGFIITGYQISGSNNEDIYILKIDSTGKKQWDNHFGGVNDDYGNFGKETRDHGYIFAGEKALATNDNETQSFIIKTDSTGNASWGYLDTNYTSVVNGVTETSGGDFVAAGYDAVGVSDSVPVAENDAYLLKISSKGKRVWSTNPIKATNPFKISDILFTSFTSVSQTKDGGFLMPGIGSAYNNEKQPFGDALLVKTDSNGNISKSVATGISQNISMVSNANITVYPNPFSAQTTIDILNANLRNALLSIYDMNGNEVRHIENINSGIINIDRKSLISGMYFYRLVNNGQMIGTGKLMAE